MVIILIVVVVVVAPVVNAVAGAAVAFVIFVVVCVLPKVTHLKNFKGTALYTRQHCTLTVDSSKLVQ
jgi:hypothetical protein